MSNRSSALRCPCWRRKRLRIRSRLLERLPPAGRRLAMSGRGRSTVISKGPALTGISQRPAVAGPPLLIGCKRLAAPAGGGRVGVLDRETAASNRIDEVHFRPL